MKNQEMFDRAVIGLRSQEWLVSIQDGCCVYASFDNGMRCAWGWIDRSLGPLTTGTIASLRGRQVGLVMQLSPSQLMFAERLQKAHDTSVDRGPEYMERAFRNLGDEFGLVWPESNEQ